MGKIIHGNKNFGFAPIVDNEGVKSFGVPQLIPGLVSATVEVDQENTNIYADDDVYCVTKGAKIRTATASFRYIPAAYLPYLGFKQADNGGFSDTGLFANHAIFFETGGEDCDTGVTAKKLHFLYNVKASEPNVESQTDEEDVEAQELEVSYNAQTSDFVRDIDGEGVQYFFIERTDENASLYDSFVNAIIMPTSEVPGSF